MSINSILNLSAIASVTAEESIQREHLWEENVPFEGSPWSRSIWKRLFDLICVVPALLCLSPLIMIVGAIVRFTSKGPVLFRQDRVGLYRRTFTIYKFRTMLHDIAENGPCVTKAGDPRFTPVGRFLRKYKLDEIPQLYNVLRGDMSLVGPRPKLPQHEHLAMHYRPGLTGAATLAFADEEHMLESIPDDDLEEFHMHVVSSTKRLIDSHYQDTATFCGDFRLLAYTLLKQRNCLDTYTLAILETFISRHLMKSGNDESKYAPL